MFERYPDYRTNVFLLATYDWETDLEANLRFFDGHGELPMLAMVNPVNPGNGGARYYAQFSDEQRQGFQRQEQDLLHRYLDGVAAGTRSAGFLRALFRQRFIQSVIRPRANDRKLPLLPFTGTCVPGEKISVRTDGTFDVCERVNSTMPIGHVDRGIDFDALTRLVAAYNAALGDRCLTCPITKTCGLCFGDGMTMQDGCFAVDDRRCDNLRHNTAREFASIYSALERNPRAIDEFAPANDPFKAYVF
jgi:uncharacterized protein